MTGSATFVLVHGAWQGAWAWETIVARLQAAGHRAIAVDLPGDGHDNTPPQDVNVGLYAQRIAAIVDDIAGPVVLVGHSMGGCAVAQACELRPDRIALAIYLAHGQPHGFRPLRLVEGCIAETNLRPVSVGNLILLATDIEAGDAPALCERFVA